MPRRAAARQRPTVPLPATVTPPPVQKHFVFACKAAYDFITGEDRRKSSTSGLRDGMPDEFGRRGMFELA